MRKKTVIKRHPVQPDRKFTSSIVSQLINKVMKNGEKRKAAKIVYQTAQIVEKSWQEQQQKETKPTVKKEVKLKKAGEKISSASQKVQLTEPITETGQEPELAQNISPPFLTVLEGTLANTKPNLELKTRKLGGAKYRIPIKVSEQRALSLALRWIVENARKRKSTQPIFQRLAAEIIDAYHKTGGAFHHKETIQKEARGNMAFASALNR